MSAKREHSTELQPIELYPLPVTWRWGTVSDVGAEQKNAIVDGPFGSNLKLSDYVEDGTVPVLTTKNLAGTYDDFRYISQKKFEELKRSAVYTGDILMAKIGSCGKTGMYLSKVSPAMIPANLLKVSVSEKFDRKFVFYYFNSPFFQKALKTIIKATAQPAFGVTNFRTLPLPIAKLTVQQEIVAEIEKQFSRLDEAVAGLKRIKANLKRYKDSVLKAAVEGKLTEEWRSRRGAACCALEGRASPAPTKDETGADLLKRILIERKKKWEEKNPGKKYKEPVAPDTSNLPELPEGWVWSGLGQIAWSVKDGPHYSPKYSETGIQFISGGNVRPEGIDFSTAKHIPELHAELSHRCKPEYGDLLYTKGGTTGIARINTEKREFNVWVHVAVLKLVDSVERFYIQHALNSAHCYRQSQKYTHGVGNQDLGLTRMVWITVPLPPLEEQRAIISEIDRRLSIIRETEHEVEVNLKRAERLRQAILQKTFSGQLSMET